MIGGEERGKRGGRGIGERGTEMVCEGGTRMYANGSDSGSEREAVIGIYGLRDVKRQAGEWTVTHTRNKGAEVVRWGSAF